MNLRAVIIQRIKTNGCSGNWLLDLFWHLIGHGASPAEAIAAMEAFVDELIAIKARGPQLVE